MASVPATTEAPVAEYAPAPLVGLPISTEGQWTPVAEVGGAPVLWKSTFHPLTAAPDVTASAMVIDQSRLHAALYNGSTLPGGGPWKNGNRVGGDALPALVAAFNGGFLFKHILGGYMTEGHTAKPLVKGQATLAVRNDGQLALGVYGRDMVNDGSWVSMRQNMPPIVLDGQVSLSRYPGTYWGDDFHHVLSTFRSAICARDDGKLMYVVMGNVEIKPLAKELVALGCQTAMELDINGHWPQFAWYQGAGTSSRSGVLLDRRMNKPNRYLNGSDTDFIALCDPTTLPDGAVA